MNLLGWSILIRDSDSDSFGVMPSRDQRWPALLASSMITATTSFGVATIVGPADRDDPFGTIVFQATGGSRFESRWHQLNAVISRIPPLGPIVLWFVLYVGNPSNRFDILQSKFHRCNQPQWSSVFDSQWLSIVVSRK